MKLINEPEKVTYRYINTETKEIDLITFQNFQKLFIENDMTWRKKSNEFINTVRTPTGRDRIEQITTKNFNQNAYLDKVDRENTFWLLQEGKVYRSVNWVHRYYTSFDHSVNFEDKLLIISNKSEEEVLNKKSVRKENLFTQHMNILKH